MKLKILVLENVKSMLEVGQRVTMSKCDVLVIPPHPDNLYHLSPFGKLMHSVKGVPVLYAYLDIKTGDTIQII